MNRKAWDVTVFALALLCLLLATISAWREEYPRATFDLVLGLWLTTRIEKEGGR